MPAQLAEQAVAPAPDARPTTDETSPATEGPTAASPLATEAGGLEAPPILHTAVDQTAMGAAVLPGQPDPTVPDGVAGGAPAVAPAVLPQTAAGPAGAPAAQSAQITAATAGAPLPADGAGPGSAPAPGAIALPADLLAGQTGADAKGQDHPGQPDGAPDLSTLPAPTAQDAPIAAPATTPPVAPTAAADTATLAAPAAAAPTTAPLTAQPAATPLTAAPIAAGVPQLTRASVTAAAEHVHDLVRIATLRSGGARATLQLKPVELGAIDVHLRTTREGLVATIAAHDQLGLEALQQAGGELRRSLEDRGVQLHRLDLQLSGGAAGGGFGNGADARQASAEARGGRHATLPGDDLPAEEHDLALTPATSTPAGALVDVQA